MTSSRSLLVVHAGAAVVLIWLAWRLSHSVAAAPAGAAALRARLWVELVAQGVAVAFLAPQSASLLALAFLVSFQGRGMLRPSSP